MPRTPRTRQFAALVLVALSAAHAPAAQTPATQTPAEAGWRAYPAFNEVTAVTATADAVWAGTTAGVFSFDPATGEFARVTSVDGLRGGALTTLAAAADGAIWAGYASGALDRIDPATGAVRTLLDIERATQFGTRGVRRILVQGDSLLVATDFGLVVVDARAPEDGGGVVRNTYARLGPLAPATPVADVLLAPTPDGAPGLWLATPEGIVVADRRRTDLQSPAAWSRDAGWSGPALSLAALGGAVYAGGGPAGARDLYRREPSGAWSRQLFTNLDLTTLVRTADGLAALSAFAVDLLRPGGAPTRYVPEGSVSMRGLAVGPGGTLWAGDAVTGLFPLPAAPDAGAPVPFSPAPVGPAGPGSSRTADLAVGPDGTLWTVTFGIEALPIPPTVNRLSPDGAWSVRRGPEELDLLGAAGFRSVAVGPDGTAYVGSGGDGLVVIAPDGTTERFDESNSSLTTADPRDPSFTVISDVAVERDRRWVANLQGRRPLHLFAADGTWTGLPWPQNAPTPGDGPFSIAIDRTGQKWLPLGGAGLAVWDTGDAPEDPADDRIRFYRGPGTNGSGLPDGDVRDVAVDGRGQVWIGTGRGLATVFSPGSAFGQDPALAVPQWTIIPPDALNPVTDYFLRDVAVNDLEVDPAGRVWVATTSGAFLVDQAPGGAGYVTVREITSAGTPLPSSDILRIAASPADGRIYLTTNEGVFSVAGDATRPDPDSDELRAAPSPFRPAEAPGGVLVSGLTAPRSEVRIATLAGDVVYAASVAGGSFRWDGRDARTGAAVASGVYLVLAAGEDGSRVQGRIAVLR